MPDKHLGWFSASTEFIIDRLGVKTSAARSMVATEILVTYFLALCVVVFLGHDLIIFIIETLAKKPTSPNSLDVFYVSVVVLVVSIIAVLWRESLNRDN